MPDPSPSQSLVTAFFATVRGRLITALTLIVLLLGIVAEAIDKLVILMNPVTTYNSALAQRQQQIAQGQAASSSSAAYAIANAIANVPPPSARTGVGKGVLKIENHEDCKKAADPMDGDECRLEFWRREADMLVNHKHVSVGTVTGTHGTQFNFDLRE
jgi:hypothetical protein